VPDTDYFEVLADINRVCAALTAHKAKGDEGDFAASIDALSEDEAAEIARLFVEIDAKLQKMHKGGYMK